MFRVREIKSITTVSATSLIHGPSILDMIWEMHEGGKRKDASSKAKQASNLRSGNELICEQCLRYAATFMLRAENAVKQATLKPDDQIWLSVFIALQTMLAHRTNCLACDQVKADITRPLQAYPLDSSTQSSIQTIPRTWSLQEFWRK